MDKKDWDWTIEATDKGFFFFEMRCIPEFGCGRYTFKETQAAKQIFDKIDNPSIPRTDEEGRKLIDNIKALIKT